MLSVTSILTGVLAFLAGTGAPSSLARFKTNGEGRGRVRGAAPPQSPCASGTRSNLLAGLAQSLPRARASWGPGLLSLFPTLGTHSKLTRVAAGGLQLPRAVGQTPPFPPLEPSEACGLTGSRRGLSQVPVSESHTMSSSPVS